MKWTLLAVVLGFLMDLCFGDPRWLYHPVRIIGHGITFLEKILRKIFPKTKTGERIAGGLLVVGLVGLAGAYFCLRQAQEWSEVRTEDIPQMKMQPFFKKKDASEK